MNRSSWVVTGVMASLLGVTGVAAYQGWGLTTDSQVLASVRQGSLGARSVYGGGPGYGK